MKQYKFLFTDLDGTLIKTISGETFPKDATDFQLRKEVLDKIKLMPGLLGIFIVTNQGGIPEYVSEQDFKAKLTAIKTFVCQYTNVPMVVADYCISLDANNKYRKPNSGMLSRVVSSYEKTFAGKFTPDNALMIGDASGKPGQWSDTDKKTAENFGIDYMDVEDFVNVKFEE